jgi:hypothetical protein
MPDKAPAPTPAPHRDEKLHHREQLALFEVPADAGMRCEQCGRRHPTTSRRDAVEALWCDACAEAGGLHG